MLLVCVLIFLSMSLTDIYLWWKLCTSISSSEAFSLNTLQYTFHKPQLLSFKKSSTSLLGFYKCKKSNNLFSVIVSSYLDYTTEKFEIIGSGLVDQQSHRDTNTTKLDDVETQVRSGDSIESWFDTCFAPLKLPGREGVRGKIRYAFCAFLWPLRCALCLTVPDVRKTRWRQIPASHWLSFLMCCFWIGIFTVIMMWMITVIGKCLQLLFSFRWIFLSTYRTILVNSE